MPDKTSDKSPDSAQINDDELNKVVGGCMPSGQAGNVFKPPTTKPNPGPSGPPDHPNPGGGGDGPSKPIVPPPGTVIF